MNFFSVDYHVILRCLLHFIIAINVFLPLSEHHITTAKHGEASG